MIGAEDEENLAIRYLGAVLKEAGHSVMISPCSRHEQFDRCLWDINRFKPDLIGLSIPFQSLALMYFDLAKKIKDQHPEIHIIAGGHFPTFEYERILETQSAIDSVGRFEGERTMVELAEYIEQNRDISSVTNLVYREGGKIIENQCHYDFPPLDDLPRPLRSKKPQKRLGEKFSTLISSRGCWHSSCLYCCIGAFHSRKHDKFRLRDTRSVAEEISELYHKMGVPFFQFHDDNFMMPSVEETVERLKALHDAMIEEEVPINKIAFLIKARPDTVTDEVVIWLNKIGTIGVFLGIENASEKGLNSLCRRTDVASNKNALRLLYENDIAATYNLLIFHPNATPDEIKDNVEFMTSFDKFPYDFGRAEICAGTPLERMLLHEKNIKGQWPNWDYTIKDEKVENMCRIYKETFRDSTTRYARMVHLNIALGYNSKLLKRIHPGSNAEMLAAEADDIVVDVNSFIGSMVAKLSSSLDDPWKPKQISSFKDILGKGSNRRIQRIDDLNRRISNFILAEKIFSRFGLHPRFPWFAKNPSHLA